MNRRYFIKLGLGTAGLWTASHLCATQNYVYRNSVSFGPAIGQVDQHSAIIWCRATHVGVMQVAVSEKPNYSKATLVNGSEAKPDLDYNCKTVLNSLNAGTQYYFMCYMVDEDHGQRISDIVHGSFVTASNRLENIDFCWSGDTAGQGFGIDPKHGGMKTYLAMLETRPDFFVHCGDHIYADNPIKRKMTGADGVEWQNLHSHYVNRVAQTVQDFRNRYYYNHLDQHYADFHRHVPTYYLWDDHEVRNNWYPKQVFDDDRYQVKQASILAKRSRQAMTECNPIHDDAQNRLYQHIRRGPLLDVFILDMRSYRTSNRPLDDSTPAGNESIFGPQQLSWLKQALLSAKGVWKIIALDMPIGLIIADYKDGSIEGIANQSGIAEGREHEIADLLSFIHQNNIKNVHYITADVHYCASHRYSPEKAIFKSFTPFWEFVSGPLHAGTFGPNELDNTFGPELIFKGIPEDLMPNTSPAAGFQFFGRMTINAINKNLVVSHHNRDGETLWRIELEAD